MADNSAAVVADGASAVAPITTETTAAETMAAAVRDTTIMTVTTTTTTLTSEVEVETEATAESTTSSAEATAVKDEDAATEATVETTAVEQSLKQREGTDTAEKQELSVEQNGDAVAKQTDSSAVAEMRKDESAVGVVSVAHVGDAKDAAASVAMKVDGQDTSKSDAVEKLEKKEAGGESATATSAGAPAAQQAPKTAVGKESAAAGKRKEIGPPTADATTQGVSTSGQEATPKKQKTEPKNTVKAETPAPIPAPASAPQAAASSAAAPSTQQQPQGVSGKSPETSVTPAPIMISRDDMAKMEEDDGLVKFDVITNDGTPEHMIQLTTLKNIFAKQLPKMPKEYIVRLVFDRNHRSMVILKNGTHVIGGICYRPFLPNHFAEIAFCAINAADQVKGYGTRLMNHLKEFVKREGITHFLTYADNYAIGYFKKQGFAKVVSMPRPNWFGYIKDYDGGTLMECTIHYQIDYLRITSMVHKQRKAIQDKIKERSRAHIVYPGLEKFAEGRLMDIYMIPGVKEAGWSQATIRNSRIGTRDPGSLKTQLTQLWKAVSSHRSAWPFHEPVDTTIVVDYLEYIKDPVDLSLIAKRIESGQYISKAALRADLDKMIENCTMYNTPDTNYYKAAKDLQEFIERRIQIRDPSKQ